MRDIDLLKLQSDRAFRQYLEAIEGLSEGQCWGILPCRPGEYLHTEGSILSNIVHVACGKFINGSVGFRDLELRYRDIVARMKEFWPSAEGAQQWLRESHAYWMDSWAGVDNVEDLARNHRNEAVPAWELIAMVVQHDAYHAGQIQMLRSVVEPSDVPPPWEGDIWLQYAPDYSR